MKGMELEFFNIGKAPAEERKLLKEHIAIVLKAFLRAGIPIIAGISLNRAGKKPAFHAVVISGYALKDDGFTEVYVHDDQVGPYASVISSDGFFTWKYKRGGWSEYDSITLDTLTVPLYHKIRLPFFEIWMASKYLSRDESIKRHDLNFYDVSHYRNRLLGLNFPGKTDLLIKPMPHYLWVFEATYLDGTVEEVVLDATAPYPQVVANFTHC